MAGPLNLDGYAAAFSPFELAFIQTVWQEVAEDFAPFGVNVTTKDPGLLILWYPGGDRPDVTGGRARVASVRGGYRVTVPVRGDYAVSFAPNAG